MLLLAGPFVMLMTYAPISILVMGSTFVIYVKYAFSITTSVILNIISLVGRAARRTRIVRKSMRAE